MKRKIGDWQAILDQLGGGQFLAMVGAKDVAYSYNDKGYVGLRLKFMKNRTKANILVVQYNQDDLYDMSFWRLYRGKSELVKSIEGVYGDDLQRIFEDVTGLRTSLLGNPPKKGKLVEFPTEERIVHRRIMSHIPKIVDERVGPKSFSLPAFGQYGAEQFFFSKQASKIKKTGHRTLDAYQLFGLYSRLYKGYIAGINIIGFTRKQFVDATSEFIDAYMENKQLRIPEQYLMLYLLAAGWTAFNLARDVMPKAFWEE